MLITSGEMDKNNFYKLKLIFDHRPHTTHGCNFKRDFMFRITRRKKYVTFLIPI